MITCYIGLGSNLESPAQQLQRAVGSLAALRNCRPLGTSPVYRSAAVGPGEQPDYLNAVMALETTLTPLALLDALQAIEQRQGRRRTERWGPRTLDLDLLLYGDRQIDDTRLQVPHPRLAQRNFVLVPLAELAPKLRLLPDATEIATLLERCPPGHLERTDIRLTSQE